MRVENSVDIKFSSCPHAENSIDISSPSCPHAENSEIRGELEAENSGITRLQLNGLSTAITTVIRGK